MIYDNTDLISFVRFISCLVIGKIQNLKYVHETFSGHCVSHTIIRQVAVNTLIAADVSQLMVDI